MPRARESAARRGQAAVETALGALLMVSVLLFGIHFTELGMVGLKVQEAANHALWKVPTYRLHDTWRRDFELWRLAPAQAAVASEVEYRDLDPSARSTPPGQLLTGADPPRVVCQARAGVDAPGLLLTPLRLRAAAPGDPGLPPGDSAVACQASARAFQLRAPPTFDWFAAVPRIELQLCAVGTPVAQTCGEGLMIGVDEFAFSASEEAVECELAREGGTTCRNQPYYDLVRHISQPNPHAGAASQLARFTSGFTPIDEDAFYMSFRGSESPHGQFLESVEVSYGDVTWETTPFQQHYAVVPRSRENCWLGHPCR